MFARFSRKSVIKPSRVVSSMPKRAMSMTRFVTPRMTSFSAPKQTFRPRVASFSFSKVVNVPKTAPRFVSQPRAMRPATLKLSAPSQQNQVRRAHLIPTWSDYDVWNTIVTGRAAINAEQGATGSSSGRFKPVVLDKLKGRLGEKANFFVNACIQEAAKKGKGASQETTDTYALMRQVRSVFQAFTKHNSFIVLSSVPISGGRLYQLVDTMLKDPSIKVDAFTMGLIENYFGGKMIGNEMENAQDFTKVVNRFLEVCQLQFDTTEVAVIKTPRPLRDQEKMELYFSLVTSWNLQGVAIKEEVDPSMLMGLELTVGNRNVKIDAKEDIRALIHGVVNSTYSNFEKRMNKLSTMLKLNEQLAHPSSTFIEPPAYGELKVDRVEEFEKALML